jgi:hypothetical protein
MKGRIIKVFVVLVCVLASVVAVRWFEPPYDVPSPAFSLDGPGAPKLRDGQTLTGIVHLIVNPIRVGEWHYRGLAVDEIPAGSSHSTNVIIFELDTRKFSQTNHELFLVTERSPNPRSPLDLLSHPMQEVIDLPDKRWKVRFANTSTNASPNRH